MKVLGIIAEFNPFHKGHKYLISKAKEKSKADYVICIISGNFVQRGSPAILDKYTRSKIALLNDIDLVIEVPVVYSISSAQYFSDGAINLLKSLNIITDIAFGVEDDSINIQEIIKYVFDNNFKKLLLKYQKQGFSYVKSFKKSIIKLSNSKIEEKILNNSNISLGLAYLISMKKFNFSPNIITIKRLNLFNASDIRDKIINNKDIKQYVPKSTYDIINKNNNYIYSNMLSLILHIRLLSINKNELKDIFGVNESLANRIENKKYKFENFENFCKLLQTKNMMYSTISRAMIHIILNLTKKVVNKFLKHKYIYYAKILGVKKNSKLISILNKNSNIPLILTNKDIKNISNEGLAMLKYDIYANDIYQSILTNNYKTKFMNEYSKRLNMI